MSIRLEYFRARTVAVRGFCSALLAATLAGCLSMAGSDDKVQESIESAYRLAGLSERQAAQVLLDRFTYGARTGDIESVMAQGADAWFASQLQATAVEPVLADKLSALDALALSAQEVAARYPGFSTAAAHARRFYPGTLPPRDEPVDFAVIAEKLEVFAEGQGYERMETAYLPQLPAQKLLRALYSENQLRELMTEFWQNHFFTGISNFASRPWVLAFERDALRPNALGRFGELLQASTAHPAMLAFYHRDAQTSAIADSDSLMAQKVSALKMTSENADVSIARARAVIEQHEQEFDLILKREFWAPTGPNLEMVRSLLGLQTLGPDSRYSERDVRDAARVFTGWTVLPVGASAQWFDLDYSQAEPLGFVKRDSFWFRADQHDAAEKLVLGERFAAGGGLEEGERLLALLSRHPDTASHIAGKLVARFAGDGADVALVERLSRIYQTSEGDIGAMLETLVRSPAFWRAAARRDRVKSPFLFVVSALRASGADVAEATALVDWVTRLGQPLYRYLEPTGYPLQGEYWLEPASILSRINFAAALEANALEGAQRAEQSAAVRQVAVPAFQMH